LGVFNSLKLIFVLPEMIDLIEKKHPELNERQKSNIADVTTSFLSSVIGCGQLLGPVYAGAFTHNFGYRLTCDGVAIGCLVLAIACGLFTDLR